MHMAMIQDNGCTQGKVTTMEVIHIDMFVTISLIFTAYSRQEDKQGKQLCV